MDPSREPLSAAREPTAARGSVPERERRVPGLVVIGLIVGAGIGAGAGIYRFVQPRVKAEIDRRLAEAPTTPEGRVAAWHDFGGPSIHQRLVTARISWSQPWVVTHTVRAAREGDPPAVYGLDLTGLGVEVSRPEGMRVVVRLPRPGLLGRTFLSGSNALGVASYATEAEAPDPSRALADKFEYLVTDLEGGLAKDIPGASIDVEVDGADESSR